MLNGKKSNPVTDEVKAKLQALWTNVESPYDLSEDDVQGKRDELRPIAIELNKIALDTSTNGPAAPLRRQAFAVTLQGERVTLSEVFGLVRLAVVYVKDVLQQRLETASPKDAVLRHSANILAVARVLCEDARQNTALQAAVKGIDLAGIVADIDAIVGRSSKGFQKSFKEATPKPKKGKAEKGKKEAEKGKKEAGKGKTEGSKAEKGKAEKGKTEGGETEKPKATKK
jgi:hypothetical protein